MSCLLPCTVDFCSIPFAISSSSISPAFLFLSLFSLIRFCALLRAAALNFYSEYLSLHSRMSCRLLRFSPQTVTFSSIVLMCLLSVRMFFSFLFSLLTPSRPYLFQHLVHFVLPLILQALLPNFLWQHQVSNPNHRARSVRSGSKNGAQN